jgi:hypothetical protein
MDSHYALQYDFTDETLAIDSSQTVSHWRQSEPEKYLLLAVLKDAILTYRRRLGSADVIFKEAEQWIFDADSDRLFAFETVCAMLNLSAERIRKDLRESAHRHSLNTKCQNRE